MLPHSELCDVNSEIAQIDHDGYYSINISVHLFS